jgi:hypothetical protein
VESEKKKKSAEWEQEEEVVGDFNMKHFSNV